MSVYDGSTQTSYVRDLGVDMNTFIANGSTAGYSLSYAADSLLTSTFNLATNTNLLWNVAALGLSGFHSCLRWSALPQYYQHSHCQFYRGADQLHLGKFCHCRQLRKCNQWIRSEFSDQQFRGLYRRQ